MVSTNRSLSAAINAREVYERKLGAQPYRIMPSFLQTYLNRHC
jgi:hypothetical protein